MFSSVLIRGDKIAFSKFPGGFGVNSYVTQDLNELMTTYGLFIPVADHGMQALGMLRKQSSCVVDYHKNPEFKIIAGVKGVLISPSFSNGLEFAMIRVNSDKQLVHMPIRSGKHGFAAISQFDSLEHKLAMAVRLTETIEEAVAMFCRHTATNHNHVVIHEVKALKKLMAKPYIDYLTWENKMEDEEKKTNVTPSKI